MSVVPEAVKIAAKRAFVRTTAQGYAAAIPAGGISAAALVALAEDPNWVVIAATGAAWLLSPFLAGVAAYLSMTGSGIPTEYVEAQEAIDDEADRHQRGF